MSARNAIKGFDFPPGRILAGKYEVVTKLGRGWEGEVYLIREHVTGIERTAKFFFPHRNLRDRAALFHARKLHKLRHCPIVIQYHTKEFVRFRDQNIACLVSEFVEGELLYKFLQRQRGGRLAPFPALHLLHALAAGLESIHGVHEYHGDLHTENIMVQRYGLGFELKFLDMFNWGQPNKDNMRHDLVEAIRVFYEALGAPRHYAKLPPEVKAICCGMKRSLILKKFRSTGELRHHLETLEWN